MLLSIETVSIAASLLPLHSVWECHGGPVAWPGTPGQLDAASPPAPPQEPLKRGVASLPLATQSDQRKFVAEKLGATAGNAVAMDNADNAKSEKRIGRLEFRSVRPKMSCIQICKPRMALAATRETINIKEVAGEARKGPRLQNGTRLERWNKGAQSCKNSSWCYSTPLVTDKCP